MAAAIEKRGIVEAVGVAVGSSDLSSREQRERHIDLIAAVGAASARLHYGDQALPIAGAALKPTGSSADRIAADLAPKLWHLKAGGQEQTALRLGGTFALWLREKNEFAQTDERLLRDFAAAVIHEWTEARCMRCRGAGVLELDRRGRKVPRPTHARNARFITCDLCAGSRRALPNHQRRADCLGLDRKIYEDERWYRRFRLALVWLEQIARRLRRPLQIESGRRNIASQ